MSYSKLENEIQKLKEEINEMKSDKGCMKKAFSKINVVIGIVVSFFLTSVILWAAQISFTDGTIISADDVNNNFNELYTSNTSHETRIGALENNSIQNLFWWGRASLDTSDWSNSDGQSGTLTLPAAGGESCDSGANVCIKSFDSSTYRIIFKIPTEVTAGWADGSALSAGHCWATTAGDNEAMMYEGFGRGAVAVGSDRNGHCDSAGAISECAYVDVETDNISGDIFGVVCLKPLVN